MMTAATSVDFDVLRERTLKLFSEMLAIARRRQAESATQRLLAAHERLRDSSMIVVVCGEFKRGKSSLLNALLEENPPLFPVDTAVATSVVTVVSHEQTERVMVGLTDPGGKITDREISRREIAEYVTENGNPDNEVVVSVVSVETPNPRLASGVTLVDTPGVGGVFADHTAATLAYLPSADGIVFVSDFTQPLTASELEFLRRATEAAKVTGDVDGMIFAVTKSDLVDAEQRAQLLANTRTKLADATGRPADELIVIPVSSTDKQDYLESGDPESLADSNFATFEAELWSAVQRRRARLVLSAALADLGVGVKALLDPLNTETTALQAHTAAKLAELRKSLRDREAELKSLGSDRAEWRADLLAAVRKMGGELRLELSDRLYAAWHRLDTEYLFDPALLADPQRLVTKLDAEANLIAAAMGQLARQRAAEIQRDFAGRNGLELEIPYIEDLPAPPVPATIVTGTLYDDADRDRRWDKARHASQGGSLLGGVASAAGALIGGFLGALFTGGPGAAVGMQWGSTVGMAIGTAAGVRKGLRTASEQMEKQDVNSRRRSIITELKPLRKAQPEHLIRALDDLNVTLSRDILEELESRIRQQSESIRDATARLKAAEKATREESEKRLTALEAERAPLRRATETIAQIATGVARLGRRASPTPRSATPRPASSGGGFDWADE